MRRLNGLKGIVIAMIAAVSPVVGTALAADQTIEAFEAGQQAAWNAHDAAAYTAAFDQDADIVTTFGWHWSGRAEAASKLGDGFRLVYAQARLRLNDIKVRTLTPELAAVTLRWSIDDARTIEGGMQAGNQQGFQIQLLQRRGAGWVILSQQDTTTTGPSPQYSPASSPAGAVQSAAPAASTFPTTPPPVRRCVLARASGECLIYGKPRPAPAP